MGLNAASLTCDECGRRYGDVPNWPTLFYEGDPLQIEQEAIRAWGWRKRDGAHECPACIKAASRSDAAPTPELAASN